MVAARRAWAANLLQVWFHRLRPVQWFGPDPCVDAMLERRFDRLLRAYGRQPPHRFLTDRRTARAAILLFDQVPRNTWRGSAQAFATDRLARQLTHAVLRRGWIHGLSRQERQFVLLPLMHSETAADQQLSVQLFARNGDAGRNGFARSHQRMVARFGRFPHRNAVLGRRSTPAEAKAIAAGNHW